MIFEPGVYRRLIDPPPPTVFLAFDLSSVEELTNPTISYP
jgi:hypothetical protein